MARTLQYFAQPFWTEGSTAPRYPFTCALDAEEGGRLLSAGGADGVLVYQQWGDAGLDIYDEPELLSVIGEVPSAALAIDPDGRDPWLDDGVEAAWGADWGKAFGPF